MYSLIVREILEDGVAGLGMEMAAVVVEEAGLGVPKLERDLCGGNGHSQEQKQHGHHFHHHWSFEGFTVCWFEETHGDPQKGTLLGWRPELL